MAHHDNPRRQHRDSQQEGFSSQTRQQGSPDPTYRPQGGHAREDQRGDHGGSGYYGAQERERAPYESNYGYESSHPSYQARGAGDWSDRPGEQPSDSVGPSDGNKQGKDKEK